MTFATGITVNSRKGIRMKRIVVIVALTGLVAGFAAGCGGSGSDMASGEPEGRPAIALEPDQNHYYDYQFRCPVCGKEGLKAEFHAETDQGRIYFDRQECMQTFKQDAQKYLKQYQQMKRSPGAGKGGGQKSGKQK